MNRLLKTLGIAACLFLCVMRLQAGNCETAQKVVTKSFPVSENTTMKIDNLFGNITISEWDKNEIAITVNIKTTAKSQNAAKELLNNVVIEFKHDNNLVFAKTIRLSQKGKCNCTYNIDYQISVPKNIHYDLTNKAGDIFMENAKGDVNISLISGDFTGNEFTGNSKINVSYGKLTLKKLSGENDELTCKNGRNLSITEAKNLKINANYSKLFIGSIKNLSIESTNTDVQTLKAEKIELSSNYGKYEIGEVNELLSKNQILCSKFDINRITGTLLFASLSNGNITIHNVMPSFENIVINANNTPIKITLDAAASCKLEALASGNCGSGDIRVNSLKSNLSTLASDNAKSVTGTLGDKETPKALIKIKSDNSSININQL
jgi:hypothetical protein